MTKLEKIEELLRLKAKKYDVNLYIRYDVYSGILSYVFRRYRGGVEYRGAISICKFSSFYALDKILDNDLDEKFGSAKNLDNDDYESLYPHIPSPFISNQAETIGKLIHERFEEKQKFKIKNAISNGPATIVFWADGTKTVVKTQDEAFDAEKGLAMAIAKRALGDTSAYYDVFKKWLPKINGGQTVEPIKASEALKRLGDALKAVDDDVTEQAIEAWNDRVTRINEDNK